MNSVYYSSTFNHKPVNTDTIKREIITTTKFFSKTKGKCQHSKAKLKN